MSQQQISFRTIEISQPNLIVNLAASIKKILPATGVNVIGSQNILDSVYKLGLKARVILIGSAAEYGDVTFEKPNTRNARFEASFIIWNDQFS